MSCLELFLNAASTWPEREALLGSDGKPVTYQDLVFRARTLAEHLRHLGIKREDLVGLYFEKEVDYIVGIMGSWLAGAAFMPLDRHHPHQRILDQVRRSGCKIVCHNDAASEGVVERLSVDSLNIGEIGFPAVSTIGPGDVGRSLEDLSYLIFTSGSSGRPKGVLIEEGRLRQLVEDQIMMFVLSEQSRTLWVNSLSFDASLSDIFTTLCSGGCLVIPEKESCLSPGALVASLTTLGITHCDLPPVMLPYLDPQTFPKTFETLVIGGEAADAHKVREFSQYFRVINVYGPTEATICTSMVACDADWERPLLGDPVTGIEYRLDCGHPADDVGELLIGGQGLARSYLDESGGEDERWVCRDGQRWFRSGDLVRWRQGQYEFLGRCDSMVKIDGHLVEPAEVEGTLSSDPEVVAARCRVMDHGSGVKALRAYIVLSEQSDQKAVVDQLRQRLAGQLPSYMRPRSIEVIDSIKVLDNGKTDWRAMVQRRKNSPPRVRASFKDLWQEVLSSETPQDHDDFFDLGGNSMAVMQLCCLCRKHGMSLDPQQVYDLRRLGRIERSTDPLIPRLSRELLQSWGQDGWRSLANRRPDHDIAGHIPLVTGVTGNLGRWVVKEVLQRTKGQVACLIRGGDDQEGRMRLDDLCDDVGISSEDRSRLVVLLGDLSAHRLGLTEPAWQRWTCSISEVYHCAGEVHLLKNFSELAPSNVDATLNVVKFCLAGVIKPLHFASTLSVFVGSSQQGPVFYEEDRLDESCELYGGYAQSKWLVERLLQIYAAPLLPLTIYRFGLVTGDSQRGAFATHDFLSDFLRGIHAVGALPRGGEELRLDLSPVDEVARIMSSIAQTKATGSFHIACDEPISLSEITEAFSKVRPDYPWVDLDEFVELMMSKFTCDRQNPIWGCLLALCRSLGQDVYEGWRPFDLFQTTGVTFDKKRARETSGREHFYGKPSRSLLRLYLDHCLNHP